LVAALRWMGSGQRGGGSRPGSAEPSTVPSFVATVRLPPVWFRRRDSHGCALNSLVFLSRPALLCSDPGRTCLISRVGSQRMLFAVSTVSRS
jgi:hypothetical protein